jgi:LysM repeat protein
VILGNLLPLLAQDQPVSTVDDGVVHVVTYGDTLFRIALRYGVSVEAIIQANQLTEWDGNNIKIGQQLVIPGLSVPDDQGEVENPLVAGTPTTHTVQRGETLQIIARRYGITVDDLLRSNNIANPDVIFVGQSLNVWTTESVNAPAEEAAAAPGAQLDLNGNVVPRPEEVVVTLPTIQAEHIVQSGETLGRIAQSYGVSLADVMAMNNISNPDRVLVGQRLLIPGAGSQNLDRTNQLQGPFAIPQPTVTQGKQIIVDLSDSRVYAFQDGVLVYTALGSMGLPATPTVQGEFEIYHRVRAQTMSGPGYSLPNVEWVQYFYQGYALHGAYWHSNWGQPMSHGCVNLSNSDAMWLYNFGEIGTPVSVRL